MPEIVTLPPVEEIEERIRIPFLKWSHNCHVISHAFVRADIFPYARVARGRCRGVISQHSWIVVGHDCYDDDAPIVDPTLWSYDPEVEGIWTGTIASGLHTPHGYGNIWRYGKPPEPKDDPIELDVPLSKEAEQFLELCGPLDMHGWAFLAHAPVGGWPAAEIVEAMFNTPQLKVYLPIDLVGMLTDLNPGECYLKKEKTVE